MGPVQLQICNCTYTHTLAASLPLRACLCFNRCSFVLRQQRLKRSRIRGEQANGVNPGGCTSPVHGNGVPFSKSGGSQTLPASLSLSLSRSLLLWSSPPPTSSLPCPLCGHGTQAARQCRCICIEVFTLLLPKQQGCCTSNEPPVHKQAVGSPGGGACARGRRRRSSS